MDILLCRQQGYVSPRITFAHLSDQHYRPFRMLICDCREQVEIELVPRDRADKADAWLWDRRDIVWNFSLGRECFIEMIVVGHIGKVVSLWIEGLLAFEDVGSRGKYDIGCARQFSLCGSDCFARHAGLGFDIV